ncbi:MAG: hypothetical protein ACREE9_14995 [Stellaceae bacterium]
MRIRSAAPSVSTAAHTGGALALTGFALCAALYFVQYALRSAPGVMTGDLGHAFGLTAVGVGTLASSHFYTYTVFSLVAGAALDRLGARAPGSDWSGSAGARRLAVRGA